MSFTMTSKYIDKCNATAVKIIKMLFSKQYMPSKDHENNSAPSFKTKYIVKTEMRSDTHEVQVILGLSEDSVHDLLAEILNLSSSSSEQEEMLSSALGELTNTIAGHLANQTEFKGNFGVLYPSPPDFWIADNTLPKFENHDGFSSRVISGNLDIHTHLSIHPIQ